MAEAYNGRGTIWEAKGDLDKAVAEFDQALRLNPRYIGAYANRGLARLRQGKTVEAEQDFERRLTLNKELKPLLEQRIKEVKNGRAVKR